MSTYRPATVLSGAPLFALSAVVLDAETTGQDAAKARVVQIGGVRLRHGIVEGEVFEGLVDPGESISAQSTRIHGLSDSDVQDAEDFAGIKPRLDAFIGDRVVIGHSVAFDLTVLRLEHERADLDWRPPRSLCTRLLTRATGTQLPDYSIETIAEWLKLPLGDQHAALRDAKVTAEIFLHLVPLLRENGIRTLAEAEAASQLIGQEPGQTGKYGWTENAGGGSDLSGKPAGSVDVYPYLHRVSAIMSAPPVLVTGSTTVRKALGQIVEAKASSVFVKPTRKNSSYGIVTERDILRIVNKSGAKALSLPVSRVMSTPLETIGDTMLAYGAVGRAARLKVRHLGVVNEEGALVGALSVRDLLFKRVDDRPFVSDGLAGAETIEDMGAVWAELPVLAHRLMTEGVNPRQIAEIVSQEICALIRQAALLAEREMVDQGRGSAPCPHTLLVLGSAGRGESLFAMDQDTALVFEPGDDGDEADAWFARMARRIAEILDIVGVPRCKAGIMATNADWRMSVASWHEKIALWTGAAGSVELHQADVFFDCQPAAGTRSLGTALWNEAYSRAHGSADLQRHLALKSGDFTPALGWFGRIRTTDKGRINLKADGLMPIVSGARALSIRHDVRAHSTYERLHGLVGKPGVSESEVNNLIGAHAYFLGLLLTQQLEDMQIGVQPSNKVDISTISKEEREQLRWALEQVECMKSLIGDPMTWS